jgi:hypothetical protein
MVELSSEIAATISGITNYAVHVDVAHVTKALVLHAADATLGAVPVDLRHMLQGHQAATGGRAFAYQLVRADEAIVCEFAPNGDTVSFFSNASLGQQITQQ